MYYGDQRESMVNISSALRSKGWEIYGYKEDQSDSMTDYYDPASWDGIATKNGFILCVDIKDYNVNSYSGKEQYEYTMSYTSVNNDKIQKLQALSDDSAATEEEKDTALKMIEKFKNNQKQKTEQREKTKVLKCKYPEFMANPKACNWHVEKDGKIFAKGKGAFQFSSLPYAYDPSTNEMKTWNNRRESWTEEKQKEINKFLSFIAKINNVASGVANMGDGTEETDIEGMEAQAKEGYEKVLVNITKTVTRPVKVERKTIQKGDILSFSYHGGYWLVTEVWQNPKDITCYTYEILGSEKRGYQRLKNGKRYYQTEPNLLKEIEAGKTTLYEMKTFDEITPTEKWVKIDQTKKTVNKSYNTTNEKVQEQTQANTGSIIDYAYTITADVDTRDNSPLWVVKITDKLSKDEYIKVSGQIKNIQGYYSKFKHGFIFKYDPVEVLKSNNTNTEQKQEAKVEVNKETKQQQEQAEKAGLLEKINKSIESLQNKIDNLSGDYQTNTYKRMKEQDNRDSKIESYTVDIKILEHVQDKLINNESITALEKSLTVNAFRNEIHQWYIRKYGKYSQEIEFPFIKYDLSLDGWYNKEVPQMQKKLKKYSITNTEELIQAIDEYKIIYDKCRKWETSTQQKIKKIEREAKLHQKGDINFTPSEIALQMIELSGIDHNSRVLEPEAGIGNIADQIKKYTDNLDVCEQMYSYCELLELKGYNVVGNDFLEYNNPDYYDVIIMNPPFSDEQNHIKHAYDLLKNGGKLISITSPHWTFANDKGSKEFREWFNDLGGEVVEELESGTFEMTGVKTNIIVIDKNEETAQKVV